MNRILLNYIPLFYTDLDMQHRHIAMCAIRDQLDEHGPELNIIGIEFKVENLKLVALSHNDKDLKLTFSQSLIEPFTATSRLYNRKHMEKDLVDLIIRMIGPEYFSTVLGEILIA